MSYQDLDHEIDLEIDNAHTRVIRLVGSDRNVLELGCATGYMSRVLVDRLGCAVTGIESNAAAAERAKQVCRRVIVADLATLDYARELGDERFDVIVCADVLEHLVDPVRTLSSLLPFLAENGYLVASIPNIAHGSIVAELLEGRFAYRSEGLLDETHLRFFTIDSVYEGFERAGFVITHLERIVLEPEETEFRTDLDAFPPALVDLLRARGESTTYQFIVTARGANAGDKPGVLNEAVDRAERTGGASRAPLPPASRSKPLAGQAGHWQGLIEAILGRMRFLQDGRARQARQVGELGERLYQTNLRIRELKQVVGQRDAAIQHLQDGLREREGALHDLQQHAQRLQARLSAIESSRPWKVAQRFQRMLWRIFPAGSRRNRLYVSLVSAARRLRGGAALPPDGSSS